MPVEILLWRRNANDELEKLIKAVCTNNTNITKFQNFDYLDLPYAFE